MSRRGGPRFLLYLRVSIILPIIHVGYLNQRKENIPLRCQMCSADELWSLFRPLFFTAILRTAHLDGGFSKTASDLVHASQAKQ